MIRCLEVLEVAPAGAAGVGHGRDARAEREAVGIDAVVARVGPPLAGAGEDVHMDVDQSRRDVQSPATSTVLNAFAGSISGATAAILPPRMATSRTALILFLGSMTWPPRSSRSYGCWADALTDEEQEEKELEDSHVSPDARSEDRWSSAGIPLSCGDGEPVSSLRPTESGGQACLPQLARSVIECACRL